MAMIEKKDDEQIYSCSSDKSEEKDLQEIKLSKS